MTGRFVHVACGYTLSERFLDPQLSIILLPGEEVGSLAKRIVSLASSSCSTKKPQSVLNDRTILN